MVRNSLATLMNPQRVTSQMQEPSKNSQRGESDRANILVMIFGFVIMLAALWAADVIFTNHDGDGARTTAHATPAQSR